MINLFLRSKVMKIYSILMCLLFYILFVVITVLFSRSIKNNKEKLIEKVWGYIVLVSFIFLNLLISIFIKVL